VTAAIDDIESFLIDSGHGVPADDAPEWARRLSEACLIARAAVAGQVADPRSDDWGDKDDQILMLEQNRDELAARAASAQLAHASELEAVADRIVESLGQPNCSSWWPSSERGAAEHD